MRHWNKAHASVLNQTAFAESCEDMCMWHRSSIHAGVQKHKPTRQFAGVRCATRLQGQGRNLKKSLRKVACFDHAAGISSSDAHVQTVRPSFVDPRNALATKSVSYFLLTASLFVRRRTTSPAAREVNFIKVFRDQQFLRKLACEVSTAGQLKSVSYFFN